MRVRLENAAELASTVGRRVRVLREAIGLTQEKLAYEAGLRSKGTLSKLESGQQLSTLAVLDLLARRLGVELADLFVLPGIGGPRHDLIEASRALSAEDLDATLRVISGLRRACASLPFEEATRPLTDADAPTVIPLLGLDVAAGAFDGARVSHGTRWVRPLTSRRLHRGCFVARVVGRSMEPTLSDGAWAIFSRRVSANPIGKVVIAQCGGLVDADTAASYTVKRFRAVEALGGGETRWREVRLEPDNPAFETLVVKRDRLADLTIVAELVEVLGVTAASGAGG